MAGGGGEDNSRVGSSGIGDESGDAFAIFVRIGGGHWVNGFGEGGRGDAFTGITLTLDVKFSDTLDTVRALIVEMLRIPEDQPQNFCLEGKLLESDPGLTLCDHSIRRLSTLHMVRSLNGVTPVFVMAHAGEKLSLIHI